MLYCSYDQYAAAGGSMTEQSFTVLCARASRLRSMAFPLAGQYRTPRRARAAAVP